MHSTEKNSPFKCKSVKENNGVFSSRFSHSGIASHSRVLKTMDVTLAATGNPGCYCCWYIYYYWYWTLCCHVLDAVQKGVERKIATRSAAQHAAVSRALQQADGPQSDISQQLLDCSACTR